MPYDTNTALPASVKDHLPEHAQDIYREAFNHAHVEYQDPKKKRAKSDPLEEICHRVAWAAVKKKYMKGSDGNWHATT